MVKLISQTMATFMRFTPACDKPESDANIRPRHPAEKAAWIWIKDWQPTFSSYVRWNLAVTLDEAADIPLHLSADQRYQFRVNGETLSYGPDRDDLEHWQVTSGHLALPPGTHQFEVMTWWQAEPNDGMPQDADYGSTLDVPHPPMAQMTFRPGFLLAADGEWEDRLATGKAPWRAEVLDAAVAHRMTALKSYNDIGPEYVIDMAQWQRPVPAETEVVRAPIQASQHGIRIPGWAVAPSQRPEQLLERFGAGRIRALRLGRQDEIPWRTEDTSHRDLSQWQPILAGEISVTVPAGTEIDVIWDFETYRCGYPQLTVSAGKGARVDCGWAESLFHESSGHKVGAFSDKGHRGEIADKVWHGFEDTWHLNGQANACLPALWWRSGRYLRLRIATAGEPVVIHSLALLTTGYPLIADYAWDSSDGDWNALMPLLEHGLRVCAHETWVDCPYYEQMNYVGDTRLHALSNYAGFRDIRLSRSALSLFDQSRNGSGWVAERYPSRIRQESPTYAMLYPLMVRDLLLWRGEEAFIKSLLPGLRSLGAMIVALRKEGQLIGRLHGWPFVDWSTEWPESYAPGIEEGDSALINLHAVHAFEAIAQVEAYQGDTHLAAFYREQAEDLMEQILLRYWDHDKGCLKDTTIAASYSEHAQCLLILAEAASDKHKQACLQTLLQDTSLTRTTVYFSFYLLEALWQQRQSEAFHNRLQWWKSLPERGFTALPEAPEPNRSDAHGWSAHPLFHSLASIGGVRPASPGMQSLEVSPLPGHLRRFKVRVVHPRGYVTVDFRREDDDVHFGLTAPAGVDGRLHYADNHVTLKPNGERQVFAFPA